jgi:hypothetical protein
MLRLFEESGAGSLAVDSLAAPQVGGSAQDAGVPSAAPRAGAAAVAANAAAEGAH